MSASILVVDDDDDLRLAMCRVIGAAGYQVSSAANATEAFAKVESTDPDLIMLDLHLPGVSGIEILETLRKQGDLRAVIMVSAAGTIDTAVRAVQLGALDFLEKPTRNQRLLLSIENALRFSSLSKAHRELCEQIGATSELIGGSAVMESVRQLIAKVAPSEGRVLILGENGTGKELAANAIHKASTRSAKPFVKVNCGAIPENLIESELFGHEKGAFTGAVAQRRGRFEAAHGGTLFLDEIGDMPAAMQVKLLRVLQEGTIERVGGTRSIEVDVRVVAATHQNLAEMVARGEFREDLYYRLDVVTITMPALRERREDIPELARKLLDRAAERNGRKRMEIEASALEILSALDFPGNVRELSNLVERLVIMGDGASIRATDVQRVTRGILSEGKVASAAATSPSNEFVPGASYRERVRQAEREILASAIRAFHGNKSAAARALGLERAHFAKKCRAVGLDESEQPGGRPA
jgi:DNA-binding NtrC family response regulator